MSELKSLYVDQLKQLWSASCQIGDNLDSLADAASDEALADRLRMAKGRIARHAGLLKSLLATLGGEMEPEHDWETEHRVAGARQEAVGAQPGMSTRDGAIDSRLRRVCQYEMGAFATVEAIAKALSEDGAARRLGEAREDICKSGRFMAGVPVRSRGAGLAS